MLPRQGGGGLQFVPERRQSSGQMDREVYHLIFTRLMKTEKGAAKSSSYPAIQTHGPGVQSREIQARPRLDPKAAIDSKKRSIGASTWTRVR